MGKLDVDVITALGHYVREGMDPGSFGRAILAQDEELAYLNAHSLLKRGSREELFQYTPEEDVVANMLRFVRLHIPLEAQGSHEVVNAWMENGGLMSERIDYATIAVELKLRNLDNWWDRKKVYPI
jgi:hypothetical protein